MPTVSHNVAAFSREHRANQKHVSRTHWHMKHELYYLMNGTTKYLVGEKPYFLEKGNLIFIPKGTLHRTDSEECLNTERLLMNFDDDFIPESYMSFIEDLSADNFIYIPPEHISEIEELFLKIEEESINRNPHSQQMLELYTLQLIVLISRLREKEPRPNLSSYDSQIYEISKYIRKNYHANLTLDFLSEQFAISKSYLSRRFKKVLGIGISDYISYVRVLHAEQLLKTTNYPITRIAEECGFNDSNYFSTVFKQTKGVTPYKFRRLYLKENENN